MQLTRCAQIVPTTQSGISAINITIQQNQGGEHLKKYSFWHKTSLLERYLTEAWKKYHRKICFKHILFLLLHMVFSRTEYIAYDNTYLIRCLHCMSRCPFKTLIFTAKQHSQNNLLSLGTRNTDSFFAVEPKLIFIYFHRSSNPYVSPPISCGTTFHNESNNFSKRSSILLITEFHCLEPDKDVSCWEWDI